MSTNRLISGKAPRTSRAQFRRELGAADGRKLRFGRQALAPGYNVERAVVRRRQASGHAQTAPSAPRPYPISRSRANRARGRSPVVRRFERSVHIVFHTSSGVGRRFSVLEGPGGLPLRSPSSTISRSWRISHVGRRQLESDESPTGADRELQQRGTSLAGREPHAGYPPFGTNRARRSFVGRHDQVGSSTPFRSVIQRDLQSAATEVVNGFWITEIVYLVSNRLCVAP